MMALKSRLIPEFWNVLAHPMSNGRLMSLLGMLLIIFLLILAPLLTRAGGDEVVIVYNKRMPGSEAVAEYYAKMRQVPQRQIYGFSLTTDETMSRDEFRDALQLSLAHRLEVRRPLAVWFRDQRWDQRGATAR